MLQLPSEVIAGIEDSIVKQYKRFCTLVDASAASYMNRNGSATSSSSGWPLGSSSSSAAVYRSDVYSRYGHSAASDPAASGCIDQSGLAAVIAARQAGIEQCTTDAATAHKQLLQASIKVIQAMYQGIPVMLQFCRSTVMDKYHPLDQSEEELHNAHTESLKWKLRRTDGQVQIQTYTNETMPAVMAIHAQLSEAAQQLASQLEAAHLTLQSYESQGPGMKQVADAYARVRAELCCAQAQLATMRELEAELAARHGAQPVASARQW
uniref:Uncharacterized protein n=1 Tax=Chlamydomonas leiostraca TaxID=1034604 RepID=A0A7S0WGF9_9CHLO|mmetsp:Transcript_13144/g.32153  ORF Transcript_13144/g.32153 Transcript_13144/m.32153 type:complete len:266 (+) Transcript_13144:287-1084(+)